MTFVYVMAQDNPGDEDGFDLCKIGVSDNPKKRMGDLQVGNPHQISLLYTVKLPSREIAEQVEAAAHKDIEKHRISGEWFCCPWVAASIAIDEARAAIFRHRAAANAKRNKVASVFQNHGDAT